MNMLMVPTLQDQPCDSGKEVAFSMEEFVAPCRVYTDECAWATPVSPKLGDPS